MNTLSLSSLVPILSLKQDRRLGQSPGGWSLYESPDGWVYLGCATPHETEYLLPLHEDLIQNFRKIASSHTVEIDQESIAEEESTQEAEEVDDLDDDEYSIESDEDDEEEPAQNNGDYLSLRPRKDRVIGSGEDIIGMATSSGVPYFLYREHCVICDALPFRIAFSLLEKETDVKIQTDASDPRQACIHLHQKALHLCFHLVHPHTQTLKTTDDCIHATPLCLLGTHKGKSLNFKLQP